MCSVCAIFCTLYLMHTIAASVAPFNFSLCRSTNLTHIFLDEYHASQRPLSEDGVSWLRLGVAMYRHSENQIGWASLKPNALQSLNHAISLASLNPDITAQAKMWRGIVLRSMSRLDDALKSFQDAAEINLKYLNNSAELENSIAQQATTLTAMGRLLEAVEKYKLLLSLNPKYKLSLYLPMVRCLEEMGNFTEWAQLQQEIKFTLKEQEMLHPVESTSHGQLSTIQKTAESQGQLSHTGSAYFALFKVASSLCLH